MYGVDEYDKMDKKYNYRDIEFGMNVLNHRVGEDESVREWLQDEEHKQLLENCVGFGKGAWRQSVKRNRMSMENGKG